MRKGSQKIKIEKDALEQLLIDGHSICNIGKLLNVHRVTVGNYIKKYKINKKALQFNENFFESIDSEDKAYWLGFIMADGCVSMTHSPKVVIKLAAKDRSHLIKWHKAINSCLKICDLTIGVHSQHYSRKMCNDLINLGCTPRKSNTLIFPKINTNLLNHLARGYFDGDGCASITKKKQLKISFVGTEQFLSSLQSILGTKNKLRPTGTNKTARVLEFHGNKKARSISDWLYADATIYLKRKKDVCHSDLRICL